MATSVWGIVKEGRVVPTSPLPEGAHVEIRVADPPTDVSPSPPPELPAELGPEFEAWDRASAHALDLVERLAREGEGEINDPR